MKLRAILLSGFLVLAPAAWGADEQPITLQNWKNHPAVKEVRAIQEEISRGIAAGKYTVKGRHFDTDSRRCTGSYPIVDEALYLDHQGHAVLYRVRQMAYHDDMFVMDWYYDGNGRLRFYFEDRWSYNIRVYFDRNGKKLWAVHQERDPELPGQEYSEGFEGEAAPNTEAEARREFQKRKECPEVKLPKGAHF